MSASIEYRPDGWEADAAPRVPRAVAFIPARMGSKRVPGKNIRVLAGHPLLAYTIAPAVASGVFESVIVSTDSEAIAEVARHYGAEVPFLRPAAFAGDVSPDIEWLEHALVEFRNQGRVWDVFALLRPTSPFRTAATILRAWTSFVGQQGVDSLRAVEKCTQHPGKMWVVRGARMVPLLPFELAVPAPHGEGKTPTPPQGDDPAALKELVARKPGGEGGQPWHSTPYQALPPVYVQNASLELAWTRVVFERRSIAGDVLMPFITEGHEGFDINDPYDWMLAQRLLEEGSVTLPDVRPEPYGG